MYRIILDRRARVIIVQAKKMRTLADEFTDFSFRRALYIFFFVRSVINNIRDAFGRQRARHRPTIINGARRRRSFETRALYKSYRALRTCARPATSSRPPVSRRTSRLRVQYAPGGWFITTVRNSRPVTVRGVPKKWRRAFMVRTF